MRSNWLAHVLCLIAAVLLMISPAAANIEMQCPPDVDGIDTDYNGIIDDDHVCMHITASDGYAVMADGKLQYIFGFNDVTDITDPDLVVTTGMRKANWPSPTITVDEGQKLYLTLTNVGMMDRPDLFDPHTVHWHGFPNASAIFDGVPDASISVGMLASLSYFYNVPEPGTYMYHCHVEATEHMQMGMLGNLYVRPRQNKLPDGTDLNGFTHRNDPLATPPIQYQYVYNDGDGSTYYDVDFPIQMGSFDSVFHDASMNTEPLPFALMKDNYAMLNGRGYPDTVLQEPMGAVEENGFRDSQLHDSLVEATVGEKILLRLSNLNVTRFYTLATTGLPMLIVGKDAKQLRGSTGLNLYYQTQSVTLGGGEAVDAIIDTAGVEPGVYFLYTTNLNYLSNGGEDFGGMMTEIRINGENAQ